MAPSIANKTPQGYGVTNLYLMSYPRCPILMIINTCSHHSMFYRPFHSKTLKIKWSIPDLRNLSQIPNNPKNPILISFLFQDKKYHLMEVGQNGEAGGHVDQIAQSNGIGKENRE